MTRAPNISPHRSETAAPECDDVPMKEDSRATGAGAKRRAHRGLKGVVALNRSPLARKIIIFNMMGTVILVAGVLFVNPFRDSLVLQREQGLVTEAELIADVFEAQLPTTEPEVSRDPLSVDIGKTLAAVTIGPGVDAFVFDKSGRVIAAEEGPPRGTILDGTNTQSTLITDFLNAIWETISGVLSAKDGQTEQVDSEGLAGSGFAAALAGKTTSNMARDSAGGTLFSVAAPIWNGGEVIGVVALTSAEGEIDRLVRHEREQVLQMFVIALLVSIGLSLALASTIANPLSDLAAAAELGRDRDARNMAPGRVRIPDMASRTDEIGRLSVAMRGMVAALYDRIDANEQFAADVSHEIKNPLASLRSAVGTLRVAKRDDQREKLLTVIEHDVRRLDRLLSDISNASRLDSELVKEEEDEFNLIKTIFNLSEHLGDQARQNGVDFITDLPAEPIVIRGLEERLAQVFVNLISNAVSFCEEGDAVRVWARRRENRVLVVVEDTGPGIPEQALEKVFKRFYSERPVSQFGDHSGLGLAISKQIIEAHGGVIWAENIRPTTVDATSEPLGARFVVGLPI
ncbi:histidine kinase (plasmid) [Pseudorhodobacter turbinis]|uniref:histidine kinase n=2 Tax=Pseudorhodobacter turbinis TaxID=2500533 RepID=A0A4P8EJG8_9RHOB|nr:histidine kinase [Pseudorhodobacter turbinis]